MHQTYLRKKSCRGTGTLLREMSRTGLACYQSAVSLIPTFQGY